MRNLIEFEYSPWLILVCLLTGIAYSYLQYSRETPWSPKVNTGLAVLRMLIVSFIAVLILGPLVRAVKNYYEEPVLVIAVDNSVSVVSFNDSS